MSIKAEFLDTDGNAIPDKVIITLELDIGQDRDGRGFFKRVQAARGDKLLTMLPRQNKTGARALARSLGNAVQDEVTELMEAIYPTKGNGDDTSESGPSRKK